MQVSGGGRGATIALAAGAAVVIVLAALVFFRVGAAAKVPSIVMTPPQIFVAPGQTVSYGTLAIAANNMSGSVEINASGEDGLTVALSSQSISVEQPEPVRVNVSAPPGLKPGNYTFGVGAELGQARATQSFVVVVVPVLVLIQFERFQPADLNVTMGTRVTWINLDTTIGCCDPGYHTVAFTNGTSASSPVLMRFDTWAYTFDDPGTFDYHCTIHLFMLGTVNVAS